jgi:hypothetical protein
MIFLRRPFTEEDNSTYVQTQLMSTKSKRLYSGDMSAGAQTVLPQGLVSCQVSGPS